MSKYRIVEETGLKTKTKEFLIEELVKFGFRKKKEKWKTIQRYDPYGNSSIMRFSTFKEAKEWLDYKTERVTKKYHDYE